MKWTQLAGAVVLSMAVSACADQPTAPESVLSRNHAIVPSDGNYVIIGNSESVSDLAAAVAAAGGTVTADMSQIGVVTASSADPGFAAKAAKIRGVRSVVNDLMVEWAQPVRVVDAEDVLEDQGVAGSHIGENEVYAGGQWALRAVDAPNAWDLGARGTGVRVAVLDGGIYAAHVDLASRVDVARSKSFAYSGNTLTTFNSDVGTFWHGTHVAGIIAAADDNAGAGSSNAVKIGNGVIGIAPGATIVGVKVLHGGSGAFSWVINGIYYAATPIEQGGAGADIINMSLGAVFNNQGRDAAELVVALTRAVNYANQQGVTIFVAAGNDGIDLDHTGNLISVPAQLPHVISVSATGPLGYGRGATDFTRPASYTNYGRSAISLSAPGGDFALPGTAPCTIGLTPPFVTTNQCWVFDMVLSTSRGSSAAGGYSFAAGTSMASPAAAAVAALIIEKYGRVGPAQVEAILRKSAVHPGSNGNDPFHGGGFVNAWRAVQ